MGLLCRFGWHAWAKWYSIAKYELKHAERGNVYECGEVVQRECRRCLDIQRKRVKS